jgi:hypothetical protein
LRRDRPQARRVAPLPGRQAYSEPLIPGCSVAGDQDPSRFLIRGLMPRRCPECELAASRQRPSVPRPQGRRTLTPDGCAYSSSNPACCFCDVWARGGRREWRSPCSGTLVWACSSADERKLSGPYRYGLACILPCGMAIVYSVLPFVSERTPADYGCGRNRWVWYYYLCISAVYGRSQRWVWDNDTTRRRTAESAVSC